MLKAIIFDMDGVLIDSTAYNARSLNMLLEKHGMAMTAEDVKSRAGMTLQSQVEFVEKKYGRRLDIPFDELREQVLQLQLVIMKDILVPNKHILSLIKDAKNQGIKIAVGTSSSKRRANIYLEKIHVLGHLDAIVTFEDVQRHKPEPDVFLVAAEKLDVSPADCLVIEDAVNGIMAARAAGMRVIAKKTDFHTKEELAAADMVFDDWSRLRLSEIMYLGR